MTTATGDLAGKVAIVTGGNRGVGRVIARRFLEEGASVVTCSRGDFEHPVEVASRAAHLHCDVRDVDSIGAVVDGTRERFGRVDILINNAGGSPAAPVTGTSPRFHAAIIAINLVGPMWFSQRVNEVMQEQDGGGAIVNISSMASVMATPMLAAYGAAKAGLNHLTRTLAVEWGPKVRVNCVALGTIQTEALDEVIFQHDDERKARFTASVPLRRVGRPEEIANTCIFLCSGRAPYVNGATVWADGGGGHLS